MARVVDVPPPASRITDHPYVSWMCGKWVELRWGEDFFKEPHAVANAFNAYCRRKGIVGKAVARRDLSEPGSPYRFVYVWGDAELPISEGLPVEVVAQSR